MKNSISAIIISSLIGLGAFAQQKPVDSYKQKIPGTGQVIEMVAIPEGTFLMGSPPIEKGRLGDEGPVHEVRVSGFYMAKFEITWDLYHLFMEREIDAKQPKTLTGKEVDIAVDAVSGATSPYTDMSFGMGTDGYPAICMTQFAASKFCEWLSAMTGNFYRLPTEAEWEYACRAGAASEYSFGADGGLLKEYAWFKDNSNETYQKVGMKKPNAWGLYDMHGNVAEWTLDLYIPTTYQKRKGELVVDPFERPLKTYPRVVRGGSWADNASQLRSAKRRPSSKKWKKRDPQIPKSKWWHTDATFLGFRIVRPLKSPSPEEQKRYWGYK